MFLEAMFAAFERNSEPTDLDIAASLNRLVPLSRLMAEHVEVNLHIHHVFIDGVSWPVGGSASLAKVFLFVQLQPC